MDYSKLLNGKVCIITGGARGQGFQEATLFKQHGGIVYITDILDGTDAAKSIGATYLKHDVTSESDWSDIVSKVASKNGGRIDVLINNAGVFQKGNVLKETKEGFERLNAINTTGVFLGMKHAARAMIDAGNGGAIVNISSIAGLGSSGGLIAYAASKWAVRGMTKAAANTLAKSNIRVNSIHPGLIQTDMLDEVFTNKTSKGNAEKNAHVAKSTVPLGRVADPMEVARLALFLSSEMSSYSTGSEFVVDGGNMGAAM